MDHHMLDTAASYGLLQGCNNVGGFMVGFTVRPATAGASGRNYDGPRQNTCRRIPCAVRAMTSK